MNFENDWKTTEKDVKSSSNVEFIKLGRMMTMVLMICQEVPILLSGQILPILEQCVFIMSNTVSNFQFIESLRRLMVSHPNFYNTANLLREYCTGHRGTLGRHISGRRNIPNLNHVHENVEQMMTLCIDMIRYVINPPQAIQDPQSDESDESDESNESNESDHNEQNIQGNWRVRSDQNTRSIQGNWRVRSDQNTRDTQGNWRVRSDKNTRDTHINWRIR